MTKIRVPQPVIIHTPHITLGDFLKWVGVAATGGQAKTIISSGLAVVNFEPELRRGRKLRHGDQIEITGVGWWRLVGHRHDPKTP